MALTVSITRQAHSNGELRSYGTVTFDSSYPTGGEPVTPGLFKMGAGDFDLRVFPAGGYVFEHDKANAKIKAFSQGVTTGATGAADSTSGALVLDDTGAEGVGRLMGGAVSTTYKLGPMKEVANTINLSTVVAKFEAVGAY